MPRNRVLSVAEIAVRQALVEGGADGSTVTTLSSAQEDLARRDAEISELRAKLEEQRTRASPLRMRAIIDDLCTKHGVEPAEELMKLALQKNAEGQFLLGPSDRIRIWSELIQYRMPKMKSLEVSGQVQTDVTVRVVSFREPSRVISETVVQDAEIIGRGDR